MKCTECGSDLSFDEIALHKKIVNRGASEHVCIKCLAKHFGVTVEYLEEKIEQFKSEGCTLFERG